MAYTLLRLGAMTAWLTLAILLSGAAVHASPPWDEVARRNPKAHFGHTRFSNMSSAEWHALQGGGKWPHTNSSECWKATNLVPDLPATKDWNSALTPVKDQGTCGSCWVHAAVEQVESYAAISGSPLTALSVQQVTSCQTQVYGGGNCKGGNFGFAADYIVASALMTDANYPYRSGSLGCGFGGIMGSDDFCVPGEMGASGRCLSVPNHCPVETGLENDHAGFCIDGQCNTDYFGCCLTQLSVSSNASAGLLEKSVTPLVDMPINTGAQCLFDSASATVKIKGYGYVDADENAMLSWIGTRGPLQISIDASDLNSYHSGVLTSCTAGQIDHDVQLVGYGQDNGVDYWRIRNSWGESWGENGFFRVKRGVNSCSMASNTAGYPKM